MEKKRSPRSSPGILPKSPLVYEKYKSGCAWRLVSLFAFRQGRSGKRLVSDKPGEQRDISGNAYSRSQLDLVQRLHEKCRCTDIVEEEVLCKPKTKRKSASACKKQQEKSDSKPGWELAKRKTRRNKNPSEETCEAALHGHGKAAALRQKQLSLSVFEKSGKRMNKDKEMRLKSGPDRSCKGVDSDLDQSGETINLKFCGNASAEASMSQKPRDGSKSFLKALDILSSNKELFITLLQDPNSLSAKQIEDIRGSQPAHLLAKSSFWRAKISETQMKKPGESKDLDRIVLLKPRLTSSDEDVYLRFNKIAKKLKLVVGSNRDDSRENTFLHSILSSGGSGRDREAEITQKTGDCTKRMEKTSDGVDSQPRIASTSSTAYRTSELPLFKRKKRTGSDVFKLNTESGVLPRRLMVGKREKINSSPVYDNLNAPSSRSKERNSKQRYRLCSPSKNTDVFNPKPRYHFKSFDELIQHVLDFPDEDSGTGSEITEETGSFMAFRNLRTRREDERGQEIHSESSCSEPRLEKYTTILQTDTLFSDDSSPQSADSHACEPKLEQEQPSPVSVLERLYKEDDTIIPRNVKPLPTAEQIGMSSDLNDDRRSVFEQGTVHEFIKKVLEASGLNWTELLTKCTISSELPSFLNEFSDDDNHQPRLVLDYTNEILHQIYHKQIKSWRFFLHPFIFRSDLVDETMKHIDWSLLGDSAPPSTLLSLDELMEIDMAKPGLWMELGSEIEDIVADMAERVLEELEMEIAIEVVMMKTQMQTKSCEFSRAL